MFSIKFFPDLWKSTVIIPIHKPGKKANDPTSYRPISLLSVLWKIAEVSIRDRLLNFLDEHNKLIPHQFGFRKQLSTTHQLLRVTELIADGFTQKMHTGALFLDIAKSFDRDWIKGLAYKLIHLGTPNYLIPLIYSYLTDRTFTVKLLNTISSPRRILAGTPQGNVLAPLLFNIYINDIPQHQTTTLALFADDTAILGKHQNLNFVRCFLQRHIGLMEQWLQKWKILIYVDKSVAVIFSRGSKRPKKLKMFNQELNWGNQAKYLGVVLDTKLSWQPHYDYIKDKYRKCMSMIRPYLGRNSPLNVKVKLHVYKSLQRPIITYAAPVWGCACKTRIGDFERMQSSTLRYYILSAHQYVRNDDIHRSFNLPTLQEFIYKLAVKFYENLESQEVLINVEANIRCKEFITESTPSHIAI